MLLVKLADRLHNMRTLHHIKSEDKRRRIARETMDIYAPLAERIGMYEMMNEMQTLAFQELEPDAYASITAPAEAAHGARAATSSIAIGLGLQLDLADNGLEAEVMGREKHAYSDLEEDGRAAHQLRAIVRRHGLPRHRGRRRRTATARSA